MKTSDAGRVLWCLLSVAPRTGRVGPPRGAPDCLRGGERERSRPKNRDRREKEDKAGRRVNQQLSPTRTDGTNKGTRIGAGRGRTGGERSDRSYHRLPVTLTLTPSPFSLSLSRLVWSDDRVDDRDDRLVGTIATCRRPLSVFLSRHQKRPQQRVQDRRGTRQTTFLPITAIITPQHLAITDVSLVPSSPPALLLC